MQKIEHIDALHEHIGEAYRKEIPKQMCEVAINYAYNQTATELAANGARIDLSRKRYTDQAVTWDADASVYYTNYPAAIIPKMNIDMIVETIRGGGLKFVPTSERELRLVQNLQSHGLDTNISTVLKRERIEYDNMESLSQDEIDNGSSPTPKISSVRMDLAIEFREFADTDEVYMPGGNDYLVMQLAEDWLLKQNIIQVRND